MEAGAAGSLHLRRQQAGRGHVGGVGPRLRRRDDGFLWLSGVDDGAHVDGMVKISTAGRDNQGGGVGQDGAVHRRSAGARAACGTALDYTWDTRNLPSGKHIIGAVATNAKGQKSRRRIPRCTRGNYYLTQVGRALRRADAGRARISLHNLAPSGQVTIEVLSGKEQVWKSARTATQGAMSFDWDGKGQDGKQKPKGLYTARISYRDASGKVVQTEETSFFHDREAEQKKRFATVEGQLDMRGGAGGGGQHRSGAGERKGRSGAARAPPPSRAATCSRTSTAAATRVRAKKAGWKDQEQSIQAAPRRRSRQGQLSVLIPTAFRPAGAPLSSRPRARHTRRRPGRGSVRGRPARRGRRPARSLPRYSRW